MANIVALITTAIAVLTAPVVSPPPPPAPAIAPGPQCIRGPWQGRPMESNGDYRAVSPYGDGGAYQYQPATWAGYDGYARAELAPSAIQDAKATEDFDRGPAVRHLLWPNTSRICEAFGQ
jgi:hypothetical protein